MSISNKYRRPRSFNLRAWKNQPPRFFLSAMMSFSLDMQPSNFYNVFIFYKSSKLFWVFANFFLPLAFLTLSVQSWVPGISMQIEIKFAKSLDMCKNSVYINKLSHTETQIFQILQTFINNESQWNKKSSPSLNSHQQWGFASRWEARFLKLCAWKN